MDSTFPEQLPCGVNSAEEPEFVWGLPGLSTADRAARLARKAALDPADVERALTLLCGELCGLELDREIYRREFPPEQDEACALRIDGETDDASPDYRTFAGSFLASSPGRDRAARVLATLRGKLPPVWVAVGSKRLDAPVTIATFALEETKIKCMTGNGKRLFCAEAKFTVRVCTTPPRSA